MKNWPTTRKRKRFSCEELECEIYLLLQTPKKIALRNAPTPDKGEGLQRLP